VRRVFGSFRTATTTQRPLRSLLALCASFPPPTIAILRTRNWFARWPDNRDFNPLVYPLWFLEVEKIGIICANFGANLRALEFGGSFGFGGKLL